LIGDEIIQAAARYHSIDNLSVVFVAFKKFEDYVNLGLNLQAPYKNSPSPAAYMQRTKIVELSHHPASK
jgi:hypothetical protein